MKNILGLIYQIKCASFDNNNNLYVATSTLVYLYNSAGISVVSTTFNNIQAMTYDNGKIYLSDLVRVSSYMILKIYSIPESTIIATLCNPNIPIYVDDFKDDQFLIDGDSFKIEFNKITVKNDTIFFVIKDTIITLAVGTSPNIGTYQNKENSIGVCDITGLGKQIINDIRDYSIYGKICFYNNEKYLFGLSKVIFNYRIVSNEGYGDDLLITYANYFKTQYVNRFMRIESDNTISEIDTRCYNFIFSTITTNGDIYIYEKDNTNYYINLYNNSGYLSNVYTNSVDLISGLISDNKGYAYAIKKNGLYSNIAILNSNIETPYEILSTNGDPSPCLKLIPNTYMYRSFEISNPLMMWFSFDAYLYPNCTAYFNFFTDASGSKGGCLCLSTDSSGSGVTTSTSLFIGNKTDKNDYRIVPNEWHSYKITIDSTYNIIWYIDDAINAPPSWYSESTVQLNTIKLEGINNNNNYCGFISNNNTLLIDNIFVIFS